MLLRLTYITYTVFSTNIIDLSMIARCFKCFRTEKIVTVQTLQHLILYKLLPNWLTLVKIKTKIINMGIILHDVIVMTIYQCQLLTFVASGLSSTIHRGSPSPHLAIFWYFSFKYKFHQVFKSISPETYTTRMWT